MYNGQTDQIPDELVPKMHPNRRCVRSGKAELLHRPYLFNSRCNNLCNNAFQHAASYLNNNRTKKKKQGQTRPSSFDLSLFVVHARHTLPSEAIACNLTTGKS